MNKFEQFSWPGPYMSIYIYILKLSLTFYHVKMIYYECCKVNIIEDVIQNSNKIRGWEERGMYLAFFLVFLCDPMN